MTPREEALAELRAWGRPSRRAELLEKAFLAGNTVIRELAEAAGVSRKTVYDDLRARGLDPRTDRPGGTMLAPITLEGLTGGDADDIHGRLGAPPAEESGRRRWHDEMGRLMELRFVAGHHNALLPLAEAESDTRAARDRALHLVEARWEALSTAPTSRWAAAHHAYVVAVDAAGEAIDAWAAARNAAAVYRPPYSNPTAMQRLLEQYAELVPAERRVDMVPDDGQDTAARLRATLAATHERRRAVAAQTLQLLGRQDLDNAPPE